MAEQGLVEAFVPALGGRLVRLAGDGLDPEPGDVIDELAQQPPSGPSSSRAR